MTALVLSSANYSTRYANTVERVKSAYFLPTYIARLTGWVKSSGNGYWFTMCPLCQREERRVSKHTFWLNRDLCGCFKPKCRLHGKHDVIALHAILNNLTNQESIKDLARGLSG